MFNLIYKWTDKIKSKVAELSKKLGEKGQGMVEYAMIIAAVAIIAVIVLWNNGTNSLSAAVKNAFGVAATNINNAATEGGNVGSNPSGGSTEGGTGGT